MLGCTHGVVRESSIGIQETLTHRRFACCSRRLPEPNPDSQEIWMLLREAPEAQASSLRVTIRIRVRVRLSKLR